MLCYVAEFQTSCCGVRNAGIAGAAPTCNVCVFRSLHSPSGWAECGPVPTSPPPAWFLGCLATLYQLQTTREMRDPHEGSART
jgi:hypothetical protein